MSADSTHGDRLMRTALAHTDEVLAQWRGATSFLESYLERAIGTAIDAEAPAEARPTGQARIEVPGWDRKLGGFDLRVALGQRELLIETKVDDIEDTLWDLLKLASGLGLAEVAAGYLVVAAKKQRWSSQGDCVDLFHPNGGRRWRTSELVTRWSRAWGRLVGPHGGSARPLVLPELLETRFIACETVTAFPTYEIRCVGVRRVGLETVSFVNGWPADTRRQEESGEDGDEIDPRIERQILADANRTIDQRRG